MRLLVVCVWLCPLIGFAAEPPGSFVRLRAPEPPNIIFIVASHLSRSDLGCYGGTNGATPNIDRMAAEGIRFTQYHAGSSLVGPSQATLLTGLHTGHLRLRSSCPTPLDEEAQTLAEFLKPIGYKTGAIGRWAVGSVDTASVPPRRGFEDWVGLLDPRQFHDYYGPSFWRNDREIQTINRLEGVFIPDYLCYVRSNYVRVTKYFPFFLHYPISLPGPEQLEDGSKLAPSRQVRLAKLDREVGDVIRHLQALDLDAVTAVFLTSDQPALPQSHQSGGPSLPELTQANLVAPLVVRWPAKVKPDQETDLLCASWDLFPTVAAMAGTNAPPNLDGISLLPTLLGQEQTTQHDYLYWTIEGAGQQQQAVRVGQWHATQELRVSPVDSKSETAPPEAEVLQKIKETMREAEKPPSP